MASKISVIIPVYNVEKYLARCLDSLLDSTFTDYEIIIIDDGSLDNSSNIAKKYAHDNDKISYFRQRNKGLQGARNTGIAKSNGKYIVFIDSDDYVSKDYLEKLYTAITDNDADIAVCGFLRVDEDSKHCFSKEMSRQKNTIISLNEDISSLLELNTAVWNKIYKSSLVKTAMQTELSPRLMEDVVFSNLLYVKAKKIAFTPEYLYYYMVRKDSLINSINLNELKETRLALEKVRDIYKENGQTFLDYIDAEAFLHFGISLMYRLYASKTPNFNKILKENTKYLNEKFPGWKKNRYISLKYVLSTKGSNAKLWIVRQFYKVPGGFKFFLFCYTFMIDKLKVDMKW